MSESSFLCAGCGTELAPTLLTCPNCHRLVHSDRLKALADLATQATQPVDAIVAWREALSLLPPGTRQYVVIQAKIAELGQSIDAPSKPPSASDASGPWSGGVAGLGAIGLMLWKLKTFFFVALTKGKVLLLGLTKASTFSTMMLSFGVYWTMFGWPLALGLVLSIYIHEMGHMFALTRYGVKTTAPMFIPGIGALIRMQQPLGDPRQDARIGLAGPLWGLGAAVGAFGLNLATGLPIFLLIARLGAFINLFNLLPFGSLDGGRAFRSMSKNQRWMAVLGLGAIMSLTHDDQATGMLTLLMIGGVFTTLASKAHEIPDRQGLVSYLGLAALLTLMLAIPDLMPQD